MSVLKLAKVAEYRVYPQGFSLTVHIKSFQSCVNNRFSVSVKHEMRYPLKEENVKEILHDVLNELYYSKGKKERYRNHNH
jgi:hypothetical protein